MEFRPEKMRNGRNRAQKRTLTIPSVIRTTADIEVERQRLGENHKFRTLSLLGQTIKIKAVEFAPGVHNPGADTALDFIARGIEIACKNLHLTFEASGTAPIIGIASSSQDFFGAGSVIIGSLATFADRLSTLLARSICFDTTGHRILVDDNRMLRRIRANADLREEWERFMLFGAGIFFKNAPTRHSLTKRQNTLKLQLMSAIEVFGLAQEYGQSIARYMHANADGSEIEPMADRIAWSIGRFLGKRCFAGNFSGSRNTWMESGAGAVALLSTVRAVRCTRDVIQTGTHDDDARPTYVDRLCALEVWDGFANDPERQRFKYQRWLVGRLVPSIFNELKMRFWAGHKAGFRPVPIDSIRKDVQNTHQGLVEILTKDTGTSSSLESSEEEAFAKYVGSSTADLSANSVALEAALKALRNQKGAPAIASQYLKYYQNKSVKDFAVSIVKSKVGIVDPLISPSVAERLSVGRTDGTRAGLQDAMNVYCLMLEPVCEELGLPLHGGVACGIAWNPASGAAQMTVAEGEGLILVPESVFMLCHFVSKLLAKAIPIKVEGERLAFDCDPASVLTNLRINERLRKYAAGGLAYCATWNRSTLTPLPPTREDQRVLWRELLMGTELFVVAHEYAHHIRRHGTTVQASVDGISSDLSKAQELDADYYGGLLTANVGVKQRLTFARYGSASVVALVAVDLLRRTRDVLATGRVMDFSSDTHPPLGVRILNLQRISYDPREAEQVLANQECFNSIMEGIWCLVLPLLNEMHVHGVRPLPVVKEEAQWLPFANNPDQVRLNATK